MLSFLQSAETRLALFVAWVLVFVLPFRIAVRMLAGRQPERVRPNELATGLDIGRRIRRVAPGLPFKTTCLVRAMAGWMMLRRRRVPAIVRFGVRVEAGQLAAHAWLMVRDRAVLGGDEAEGYTPIGDFGQGIQTVPRIWSDH